MSDYQPVPLDLSHIELSESLAEITERLAEQVHDVWAHERIADGWTLGPERDDESKKHPCLVPYDELPERERDYDRNTAINTLKLILNLGYQIVAPDSAVAADSKFGREKISEIKTKLRSGDSMSTRDLGLLWRMREVHLWALHPELFETLTNTLLKRGYPLLANEVVLEGLRVSPKSIRLRQLHALGLMRTGRPRRARAILEALIEEAPENRTGEALGLLASSHKVRWSSAQDEEERNESLKLCYGTYRSAFEQTGEYYPGINAAAMAVVSGQKVEGQRIAAQVEEICEQAVEAGDRSYWTLATIAEAALIEGELKRATEYYQQAVELAPHNFDSISATRRQAVMLAEKLKIDDADIRRALPVPPVAIFGGPPCWREGRIGLSTIENEAAFREQLREEIRRSELKLAYASGVGGGDLLFLEAMIEEKGEVHMVLPAPADDLAALFGSFGDQGGQWATRFKRVVARASSMTVASRDLGSANPEVFGYATRILAGAAVLRGRSLGTPVHLIELDVPNGASVSAFKNRDIFDEISRLSVPSFTWTGSHSTSICGLSAETKGILFADLKGYSKIAESEIPLFITEFLTGAGDLCDSEPGLQYRNTWGDAFYLVFDTVQTAARFGKQLRAYVKDTDWKKRGFSQDFGIRISLHAGPLFSFEDPVLHQPTFSGQHASRGARIEPITDEGQIFVTEPFACLAAEMDALDPQFEYLGRRALAKKYGEEGLFLLM